MRNIKLYRNGKYVQTFKAVGLMHKFVDGGRTANSTAKFTGFEDGKLTYDYKIGKDLVEEAKDREFENKLLEKLNIEFDEELGCHILSNSFLEIKNPDIHIIELVEKVINPLIEAVQKIQEKR